MKLAEVHILHSPGPNTYERPGLRFVPVGYISRESVARADANRSPYYMDAAVVLSLVAFMATLVLARYHGERRIF